VSSKTGCGIKIFDFANATSLRTSQEFKVFFTDERLVEIYRVFANDTPVKTARESKAFGRGIGNLFPLMPPLSKPSKNASRFLTKHDWIRLTTLPALERLQLTALTKCDLMRLTAAAGLVMSEANFKPNFFAPTAAYPQFGF